MSGEGVSIRVGAAIPAHLVIGDGSPGLFPQVELVNAAGAPVATLDLTDNGDGTYSNFSQAMPDTPFVTAMFVIYTDAGHTTESARIQRSSALYVRDLSSQPGDAMDLVADAVDAAALSTDAAEEIADTVWDEPQSDHVAAGSFGEGARRLLYDRVPVFIDPVEGTAIDSYDAGSQANPVDNFTLARTVADRIGSKHYFMRPVLGTAPTLSAAHREFVFEGTGASALAALTFGSVDVSLSSFIRLLVTGTISSPIPLHSFYQCLFGSGGVTGLSGEIYESQLQGTIVLGGVCRFYACTAGLPGNAAIIDMNGNGDAVFHDFDGEIEIRNMTAATSDLKVFLSAGTVTIDASCTAGTVVVQGNGRVINNGGASLVVLDEGLSTDVSEVHINPALEAPDTLKFDVWLIRNGRRINNPTNCVYEIKNDADIVVASGSSSSPLSHGNFHFEVSVPLLLNNDVFSVEVEITDSQGQIFTTVENIGTRG